MSSSNGQISHDPKEEKKIINYSEFPGTLFSTEGTGAGARAYC